MRTLARTLTARSHQVYRLEAFQPTDEEICTAANLEADVGKDDDDSESLDGFIVDDDEDDDDGDYGKAPQKKKKVPRMQNRAVIQSDDDDESEAEEESAPRRMKKNKVSDKGKEKADDKGKVKTTFTWGDVRTLQAPVQAQAAALTWRVDMQQEPSTKILWAYNELDRMFAENPTGAHIFLSSSNLGGD